MSLALATRGYLCRSGLVGPSIVPVPPPVVIDAAELKPGIIGSAPTARMAPIIVGGTRQVPSIGGAGAAAPSSPPTAPTITGGVSSAPSIRKADKE